MKITTKEKILALIREKESIQPKDIVENLGLNFTGIFRHLKVLVGQGFLYKVGKTPNVRYYLSIQSMISFNSKILLNIFRYAQSGDLKSIEEELFAYTVNERKHTPKYPKYCDPKNGTVKVFLRID